MSDETPLVDMSLKRFAEIVEAYGAAPRRWPAAERAAAARFAASEPRALALLEEAAMLDAMLDALPAAPANAAARGAAMPPPSTIALPGLARRWTELLELLGGWRVALPTMTMALVAGLNLGVVAGGQTTSEQVVTASAPNAQYEDQLGNAQLSNPGFAESLFLSLQQEPQR